LNKNIGGQSVFFFYIEANHLLMMRHDACFGNGGVSAVGVHDDAGYIYIPEFKIGIQDSASLIVSANRDKGGIGAKRLQIGHHIAGSTSGAMVFLNMDHRDRGFGRYPVHASSQRPIEHEVAHHENGQTGEPGNPLQ